MSGPADLETIKSKARLGAKQAGAGRGRVEGTPPAAEGAHVQKATEFSRATQTKAIPAGLATSLSHL